MADIPPAPSTVPMNEALEPAPETLSGSEDYSVPEQVVQKRTYSQPIPIPQSSGNVDVERIHEIVESVVNERWEELMAKTGNLPSWKEKINMNVIAIKQEIVRLNDRMENLQNSVLGRVKDYDSGMRDVQSEMKALEKVFERILEPLTSNIKELDRLTKEMKERR